MEITGRSLGLGVCPHSGSGTLALCSFSLWLVMRWVILLFHSLPAMGLSHGNWSHTETPKTVSQSHLLFCKFIISGVTVMKIWLTQSAWGEDFLTCLLEYQIALVAVSLITQTRFLLTLVWVLLLLKRRKSPLTTTLNRPGSSCHYCMKRTLT
jgi:hypothetical protein